ncbi:GAF domain-containing protein [Microbacterium sp. EYE_5]|uniref:GAF domain-containing protein n=1 Tax=unclassified Microbacterium TaxID=2609290 RepID=UPI00200429C6|nr:MULTISPECIES: GAF domain-containing protein [unclassified Microbacterium]MCK6079571.1 GAF domain-containing protein [Microbacterium sp. EYE_382]MCK6084842.1 GAF domain-containing protein [Microbacterium sp. EYE_384]MCK6122932.1 GAF domain-containing protein [Microbacterium sp. EYE_80]MCK6125605.1 GAF domain-containing protein [Microbacterium sp. EYE_79]MCK6140526.1 GAF domain-containing protein [Microbacterium sp. EYE_39]
MSSPWSTRVEVAPATSRLLIERAHEELLAGNAGDPRLEDVRPLVRESWRRSLASDAAAEGLPRLDMTADELEAYRRAHPLAGVMEMVRSLLLPGSPEDSGVIVAVGDASGRLLWVEGDRGIRTLTGDMGFVAGADWAEASVGTSAPGTALALDRAVQIRQAEHFNRFVQPWSCTAAPVHDPETRRLIGVIDVTGGSEAVTPQAQLLVDAAARAIEGELLVGRLRSRAEAPRRRAARTVAGGHATLRVLGRDRALLETEGDAAASVTELSARHAEILLMLASHREGLSAEVLADLVYGEPAVETLRPEMVRLRKVLEKRAPQLVPLSRPYRLPVELETDVQHVVSLLGRGAHRVALTTYTGPVLPDSVAPGVEELRASVRATLRETMVGEAGVEALLAYADSADGREDAEVLRLCLRMLPARSPRRAGLVARLQALGA